MNIDKVVSRCLLTTGRPASLWRAASEGAPQPVVVGFDVVVVVVEGDRLRGVYGFLDRVPS